MVEIARLNGDRREERVNLEKAIELAHLGRRKEDPVERYWVVNPVPNCPAGLYWQLHVVLRGMGEDAEALTALNRGLEVTGVSGDMKRHLYGVRGALYMSQGKYAAAIADYDSALLWIPGSAAPRTIIIKRRGLAHFLLGHYEQALADIAKAVELNPEDTSSLLWIPIPLVAACPDENFRKGMLALADRAIAQLHGKPATRHGVEAFTYQARARLLAAMKQPERAQVDRERAFELYQQELAKQTSTLGPDHATTLGTMGQIVLAGAEAGKLEQVKFLVIDLLSRLRKTDAHAVDDRWLALRGSTLLEQQQFAAAEPVLRVCVAVREKKMPDDWRRYDAVSMLGGALLGLKKYAEGEPLLLQGYEGIKQHESQIPTAVHAIRLHEAAERLVRLYDATNQPEKAAAWREKLSAEK
jgi:tetratricopeptide (TPR) repeat protein